MGADWTLLPEIYRTELSARRAARETRLKHPLWSVSVIYAPTLNSKQLRIRYCIPRSPEGQERRDILREKAGQ